MNDRIRILLALLIVSAAYAPILPAEPVEDMEQAFSDGNYSAAYKKALRVLKKEPDNTRVLYVAGAAGLMLAEQGESVDGGDSERYLERCLELAPDTPGAHYLLGRSSYQKGREHRYWNESARAAEAFSEAAREFEAVLLLQEGQVKALEGLALALAELPEELERAIRVHEAWIAADPSAVSVYPSLAKVLIAVGRYDDAIVQLDRLPKSSKAVSWAATFETIAALHRSEDQDSAARVIRMLEQRSPEAWYREGLRVFEHLTADRDEAAAAALELFLESDPPEQARQALLHVYAQEVPFFGKGRESMPPPDDDSVPKVIKRVAPVYPEPALREKIKARVEMIAIIRRDGTVLVVHARSNRPGLGFEQASIAAVSQWRYVPAQSDGKPTSVVFTVIMDFAAP